MPTDRSILYERWLDDLGLYLEYKHNLQKRVQRLLDSDPEADSYEHFWQEYDTLESLRELSRRALDEYISTIDASTVGEVD